jgi:hypothetical protein
MISYDIYILISAEDWLHLDSSHIILYGWCWISNLFSFLQNIKAAKVYEKMTFFWQIELTFHFYAVCFIPRMKPSVSTITDHAFVRLVEISTGPTCIRRTQNILTG